eukprot:Blabericola_migrator_1__3281@NODE_1966_length_3490_cov_103_728309_g1250_i0_p1_GENE_NODE_1966_length_3490_cov_103_728309_g1250_i0NODE_1966_length_3490_cov_103_728309_g1250_i0_p1_ORF_typecomplete_len314_score42_36_NODE_1966_length_3490_cov_103_728309_g1250_i016022543
MVGTKQQHHLAPTGASFPPAAGTSAWGVSLKTPRYTLLKEGPSPLERLFFEGDNILVEKLNKRRVAKDDGDKISSRVSPGAPYYSTSFSVAPKITESTVWSSHDEVVSTYRPPISNPLIVPSVVSAHPLESAAAIESMPSQPGRRQVQQVTHLPPVPPLVNPRLTSGEWPARSAVPEVTVYEKASPLTYSPRPADAALPSWAPQVLPFPASSSPRLRTRVSKRNSSSSNSPIIKAASSQRRFTRRKQVVPSRGKRSTETGSISSTHKRNGSEIRSVRFADDVVHQQMFLMATTQFPPPGEPHTRSRGVGCTRC